MHCLSSFVGRVNGWARFRSEVRIGEERAENMEVIMDNRRRQPIFCCVYKNVECGTFSRVIAA